MQRPKKYNHIISLSVLYSTCFFCIILAFPRTVRDTTQQEVGFFSAPEKPTGDLPTVVQRGTTSSIAQQNTTVSTLSPSQSNNKDSSLSNKLHFTDGFPVDKAHQYTMIIYDEIDNLDRMLQTSGTLQEALFSITLDNTSNDRRGQGGAQTITIHTKDITSNQEFREVVSHELGHIIDLGVVRGSTTNMDQLFTIDGNPQFAHDDPSLLFYTLSRENTSTKRADSSFKDFVGGYAMTSPFEDFAESFAFFLHHNALFRSMAKQSASLQKKYTYIANLTHHFYFDEDIANVSKLMHNPERRPRDTTRISLE